MVCSGNTLVFTVHQETFFEHLQYIKICISHKNITIGYQRAASQRMEVFIHQNNKAFFL